MSTHTPHAVPRLKASPRADPRHAWHVLPRSVPALEPGSSAAVRRLAQAVCKIAKILGGRSYGGGDGNDDGGGGDSDDEDVQQFPRYFVLCLRFATLRGRSKSKGAKDEL